MWGVEIVVMLAMIGVNSIFAAYEIALASVSLGRLDLLSTEGKRGAFAAAYMKRNLEGSLAGIQLGITLVGAVAAATGGAGAGEQLAPSLQQRYQITPALAEMLSIAIVVIPLTFTTIVFGELIPKVFALRNKEWVCLKLSPGMKWFVTIVWPFVWILEGTVTRLMSWGERFQRGNAEATKTEAAELQELRASVAMARTSRLIGAQEEKIILGAAALSSRPIREIMLAADAMSMLDADGDISDALIAAHLDMHTRFPVTERKGDPQTIIGYANFKDIIAHMRLAPDDASLRKITRSLPRFDADAKVSDCLNQLIRDHAHIALVQESNGTVVGMITLEDIIEELVGDIEDEFDHLPSHASRSGRGWIVGGGIGLQKLHELTGYTLKTGDDPQSVQNLNDWISQHLNETIHGGEVFKAEGYRFVVRKIRRGKVFEAQIEAVK